LPQEIERALSQFNLPPDLLELEISENFALQDNEAIIQSLARLRRLGVKLALDDLGTGNASLDYLTRLPVSTVKIDQSFVRSMIEDEKSAVMVRSLVAMAHGLGLKVVAEGVETPAQAELLSACKCDYAQGYLFGRPLPVREFEALLARGAILAAGTLRHLA
jgi:EAL domain-containing protein (putative c-di-GMP-specific phosphodiesterase class I)